MTDPTGGRRWSQVRRFEYLEWKMFWEGRLIRSDLEQTFGISTPQASVDLRNYRELAPDNLVSSPRGYLPSGTFSPRFLKPSADRLLLQLRAFLAGVIQGVDLWFKDMPPVALAPDITRSVSPECLRPILAAIRARKGLVIRYHSLTSEREREIAPHALAYDGHRWHIRAWCCENEEFRDFVLSRISAIHRSTQVEFDPDDDKVWSTTIQLKIRPHHKLTPTQKSAIELDYGMHEGQLLLEMRAALAFYFIRRMNFDIQDSSQLPPQRMQVELLDYDDVDRQIREANVASKTAIAARLRRT